MTPEAKVKKKVRQALTNLGAYSIMPSTGGYGSSGAPDFVACLGGYFIGIECKAGEGKLTALQMKHLNNIKVCGGIALVIDEHNVDGLETTIRLELYHLIFNEETTDG
jgi:hypothetical protein